MENTVKGAEQSAPLFKNSIFSAVANLSPLVDNIKMVTIPEG